MKTKDRYVIENGIATIRPLHPKTKEPMGTEAEIQAAWDTYAKALQDWARPVAHDPSYK
jgi:hypothetical protein